MPCASLCPQRRRRAWSAESAARHDGQGELAGDDGDGDELPEADVAGGEAACVSVEEAGDGVLVTVGELVLELGAGVHPLSEEEAGAELTGAEFLEGAVPVQIGGDEYQEDQGPVLAVLGWWSMWRP